jgi:hypothetical protein
MATISLAGGTYGTIYSQPLQATGGIPPYSWSVSSGALPPGVTLSDGTINGTPTQAGSYNFTIKASESSSLAATVSRDFTVAIGKAPLTITAVSATKSTGSANPDLTVTHTGFVNGDTADVLSGNPAITTTATTSSPVGTYDISVSQGTLTAGNYAFNFVGGTLGVTDMATNADGTTIAPIAVATASGSQVSIAAGTLLKDAAGNPIKGSLTMASTASGTISGLPAAAANSGASDGSSLVSLGASIDLVLSAGGATVKTINPAMTVTLAVPKTFTEDKSTVDYYSFDGTKWSWEGSAAVKADGTVDMQVKHLSTWAVATFKQLPKGDVNKDGNIDISDALRALQIAVGIIAPTAADLADGDVAPLVNGRPKPDRKGAITVGDAIVILQRALGIVGW